MNFPSRISSGWLYGSDSRQGTCKLRKLWQNLQQESQSQTCSTSFPSDNRCSYTSWISVGLSYPYPFFSKSASTSRTSCDYV